MKKIGKAIARKFKNWKGATTAKGDDIEESRAMPADAEEVKVEIKKQTNTVYGNVQKSVSNRIFSSTQFSIYLERKYQIET